MTPICPYRRIIPNPLPIRTSDGKTMTYIGCRDAAANHHTMLSTMRVHPINVSIWRVSLYFSRKRWASRCNVIKGIVSASMPRPMPAAERPVSASRWRQPERLTPCPLAPRTPRLAAPPGSPHHGDHPPPPPARQRLAVKGAAAGHGQDGCLVTGSWYRWGGRGGLMQTAQQQALGPALPRDLSDVQTGRVVVRVARRCLWHGRGFPRGAALVVN